MKNILAVFNCLVKVRYPNGEYHTEDDRYWMQSHQDLFETLEEAEKYISEIFDDVYERIDSDDPEECPYDLVNDEYDIYIKILNDKFDPAGYDSGSVDMLCFDHDIRANGEYLKYVDYMMLVGSSILDANKTITVATDTLMSFVTKARKKKGGSELVQMSGKCVLVQKYSDGTADCKDFFMNIDGVFHGIIYQFPAEISSDEIVEMVMTEKIAVFFPLKRVNGEKLYQAFLAAGVYINPDIPVGVVKRELEKYIVSRINTFKVELIIPITGWNAGNWYRTGKDYMRFSKYIDFPTVPVAKKVFPVIAPGKWHVEDYFKILDHIQDRMLKMWIFIYPFLGMIASLMAKFGCRLNFCLNIVTDDEEVRREITRITAIFNRENVPIISLAENRSALNKEFSKYGDEVVFVSADKTVNQDYNNEKKIYCIALKYLNKPGDIPVEKLGGRKNV